MGKEAWGLIMYLQAPLVADLWVGNFAVKKQSVHVFCWLM